MGDKIAKATKGQWDFEHVNRIINQTVAALLSRKIWKKK
jgi:hypothetical protein